MAKTTLRTYNREIETLIEQNQFEQAIAHARHILQFFPKHIHTYRLLGKAYLESQRYGDAADVFQRVLSAVPDDFVSQVGMSIIREDEGNLDEAIWHMERAFEIQPANSAIQGELRRLYGRRDGMEPPKVRLTRGALARMYLKGELYQQAIAELRAALAEDPQRPDLLALLAQAYFLTGQRVEAADICSVLLKKTPYCMDANRILADILVNTERSAEAQTYRNRAQALDPYAAHTSPAAPTPDRVPDNAVSLEKLVWTPGQPVTGPQGQPEWAASLGVDIGAAAPQKEALPEWLSEQPEQATPVAPLTPEPTETPPVPPFEEAELPALAEETPSEPSAEDEIPDWMKDIGWKPSTGAGEEPTPIEMEVPESPAPPSEEIAPAEIPDWLQGLAPEQVPAPGQVPSETGEIEMPAEASLNDSDALSWLQETPPGPTDSVVTWLETEQPTLPEIPTPEMEAGESLEVPDWLKGLEQPAQAQPVEPEPEVEPELFEAGPEAAQVEPAPEAGADLPGWLAGEALAAGVAGAAAAEELPDWLKDTGEPSEPEAKPADEFPEWLRDTGSLAARAEQPSETAQPEAAAPPPVVQPAAPASQAEDEAFAWLESLAAKQGAQEALILKPEDRRETPPDWVLEAATPEPVEPAPPEVPSVPEWPPAETPPAEELESPAEAAPAEEIPERLSGLEGESVGALQAEATEAAEPEESAQLFEELAEQPEITGEAELEGATQLFEQVGEGAETPIEATPAEEIPEWLRGIEGEGAPKAEPEEAGQLFEELPEEPEAPGIAAPDVGAWTIEEQIEDVSLEGEAEPAELPDWLQGIAPDTSPETFMEDLVLPEESLTQEPSQEQAETIESGGLPAWLSSLEPSGEAEHEPDLDMLFSPQVMATGPSESAKAEVTPELESEPVAISDTQPTRVKPSEEAAPPVEAEVPAVELPGELPSEAIPEWLRGLGEEQPPVESLAETPFAESVATPAEETAFEAPEVPGEAPFEESLPTPAEEAPFEAPETMEQPPIEVSPEAPAEPGMETPAAPLDDEAAFAWLEGLAARMGAEEALLLEPEERSETPPEWVQRASEESGMPVEELVAPPVEPISPEIPSEIGEGLPEVEAEAAEPMVSMEAVVPPEVEPESPLEPVTPAELEAEAQFEPITPTEPEAEAQFEPSPPSEPEPEVKFELFAPEEVAAEVPEAPEARPELPSWLSGVEQAGAVEEELSWTPPVEAQPEQAAESAEALPVVEPFKPEQAFPARLDLNEAGLSELERLPGVGFVRAQSIVTYRQAFGPFTSVDELVNVAGFDQDLVETLRDKVGLGEALPAEAAAEAAAEAVDIYQVTLIQARNALIQGQSAQALIHYSSLIKSQQALPDVIQDLNEALYRFPVDVSFWEALGDAHVRIGHLQDALDAYTKAEELIR
jgi:competence ComEA-like helix-hairpin-helix protein